ncbi:MAG TPA: hypothetical protein VMB50_04015, partial [Myxococcales bacterium]|nr:hypothetical protein [Myxococcales bacterium]
LPQYFEGHCSADGLSLMPPLASNFLQHPWSLGLPLGMAILLVFQLRRARELGWWAALTVLLLLLSFSQVVLFGCLGASVALAGGLTTPGKRWKQLLLFGLWGLALLATASRLHGFFAHTAEPEYLRLDFSPFWRGSIGQWALYLAMALGLGLPLGLVGFWLLRRERLVFGILAVMGLGVFSLYRYPNSWDIVKFLMVVQIAFTVTGSATLWAAFRRPWWRWLAAPALVALVAHSVLWLGTAAIGKYNGWYTTKLDPLAAPAADRRMIDYLRAHIGPGEAVWRRDATADYALLGGLPVQQPDYGASSFGFSHHAWDSRTDLVDHPRPAIDDYEKQGIRWFVLGPWDVHVHNEVDLWVKEGRAEARLKEPPLELFYAK